MIWEEWGAPFADTRSPKMSDAKESFSLLSNLVATFKSFVAMHYAFRTLDYDFDIIYPTIKHDKTFGYNATDDPIVWQFSFHEMRSAMADDRRERERGK